MAVVRAHGLVKTFGEGRAARRVLDEAALEVAEGEVVGELVRMLGAGEDDVAARRHAKELLKAA